MEAFVYGSGTYAKLVGFLAEQNGYKVIGSIDDFSPENGRKYDEIRTSILENNTAVFLGVGYNNLEARSHLLAKLLEDKVNLPNLVEPAAQLSGDLELGQANVIMAGALLAPFVEIGNGNVFWPQVGINHDSKIGDNNFFSPSCTLCGFTSVADSCFVGAGAVVVDHRKVPSHSFIKAGSLFK